MPTDSETNFRAHWGDTFQDIMKAFKLIIALFLLGSVALSAHAQSNIYSINIVGYVNRPILPGNNLVANQLFGNIDNTINNVLLGVADGATFTKWDATANAFLPTSVFNLGSQTWSINYTLNLGEGALVNSPSLTTNTFVGGVAIYTNIVSDLGPGQLWSPNYADGLHLIACPMPLSGPLSTMFAKVVGRSAESGEWVKVLDETTQTYITATFDGFGWDNDPNLPVAHAAWFNLGPVNVPEPSSMALLGMAFIGIVARRRR